MKLIEIQTPQNTTVDQVVAWLKTIGCTVSPDAVSILKDGRIQVDADISVFQKNFDTPPFKLYSANSVWIRSSGIQSLQCIPNVVNGFFSITTCTIADFNVQHLPVDVYGNFNIAGNQGIASLHGIHKRVKRIGGSGIFQCDVVPHMLGILMIPGVKRIAVREREEQDGSDIVSNILNNFIGDPLGAQEALLDAGFKEQAKL